MTGDRVLDARAALDSARSERAAAEQARAQAPQHLDLFSDPDPPADWLQPRSPSGEWTEGALETLRELASELETLTVEHLRQRVGPTYDLRALGAVLKAGARRGWIVSSGEYVNGGPERHGRPIAVWISNLRRPA